MMGTRLALACLLALICQGAWAVVQVDICFNYGCQAQATVAFTDAQIDAAASALVGARTAAEERAGIAEAVGRLYQVAASQSPIAADRAGNYADQGVHGKMDCIDHSTTTTRLLTLLQDRGLMHFHRVADKARRSTLVLFQHFSAVVEEVAAVAPGPATAALEHVPDHVPVLMALCDCPAPVPGAPQAAEVAAEPGAKFVIDSWFVEQGEPAVVLPLGDWLDGDGPYVP